MNKLLRYLTIFKNALVHALRRFSKTKDRLHIGFLVNEFFHEKSNRFGGYGMTLKYITAHFNRPGGTIKGDIILTRESEIDQLQNKFCETADVLMIPPGLKDQGKQFYEYCRLVNAKKLDAMVGVDHYQAYEYPLMAFPNIPWIIWLKDPKDAEIWRRIATVSLECKAWGLTKAEQFIEYAERDKDSLQRLLKRSKMFGRKVYFASEANDFTKIGERQFELNHINAAFLAKPIPLANISAPEYTTKPSFLFLARLDPIKRPWIYCELAKRFKDAEFLIAGQTHMPEIMNDVLAKYQNIPNLKFLGRVVGEEKDRIIRRVWATVNTSIHEGLPVAMVEGFAYGKTVIACENPDKITEQFGFYTGDVLGDGYDQRTLDVYSAAIEKIIKGQFDKEGIFNRTRDYIKRVHSFEKYEETMKGIMLTNQYQYQLR